MKIVYKIVIVFFSFMFVATKAQNVLFEKSNFPDRKDLLKEARKNFNDGTDAFVLGKKEYDFILEEYIATHHFMPVSRYDYRRAGDVYFKQALPLLQKAQEFNPNNSELNYMLGVISFNLDARDEKAITYFEKAISLNAELPSDIHYFLGWAYQMQLKWDDAIKNYQIHSSVLKTTTSNQQAALEDVLKKINECNVGKKQVKNPQRIYVDNLGPAINSKYPEYSAFITADESSIVFTSCRENSTGGKKDENNLSYFEDTYSSNKKNGVWSPAQNMGEPVNTEDHDATAGLSSDGSVLYTYKFKEKDGGDIYVSNLIGNTWTKPERLNKNINSKMHESSVSLSSDAKRLFFVSDKEGGLGDRDIYFSKLEATGDWGVATNLGPTINSKYAEEGALIHPDGKTLYFSSKGHQTMGGYDIFKSTFENGKWSEPENLGYPINGPDDDVFFVISASGYHGYFASVKQEGFGEKDIYKITFLGPEKPPMLMNEDNLLASVTAPVTEFKAEKIQNTGPRMTILKGVITDEQTKQPLEAQIELVDVVLNEIIATFKSNSSTGKYLVSLPAGKNYGIVVKREGYLFHSENFDIPETASFQEVEKNIELKKIDVGKSITLNNIFFDFNKATIRPESANELNRLIKLLMDNQTLKIELGSHTDSKGSDEYNLKLSQSRSQSVVNYLITNGISADRLVPKGYGETVPVATNDTDAGRQQNRRTDFKILSK